MEKIIVIFIRGTLGGSNSQLCFEKLRDKLPSSPKIAASLLAIFSLNAPAVDILKLKFSITTA